MLGPSSDEAPFRGWDRREEGGLDIGTEYDLEPLYP